jgi:Sec-independent protein secretion pathway component TatC
VTCYGSLPRDPVGPGSVIGSAMVDESPEQRKRWLSQLRLAAGLFLVAWVGCWFAKVDLLVWTCSAVGRAVGQAHPRLELSPGQIFVAYLELCTVGALTAVLPLLTRALVLQRRVASGAFVGLSYAVLASVLAGVQLSLAPRLVRSLALELESQALRLGDLVSLLSSVYLLELLGAQLAVALLFATNRGRARGEAWSRLLLRWVLISVGVGIAAAMVMPPEPPALGSLVAVPLDVLFGLVLLIRRWSGASSLLDDGARPHVSPNANPYSPPAEP